MRSGAIGRRSGGSDSHAAPLMLCALAARVAFVTPIGVCPGISPQGFRFTPSRQRGSIKPSSCDVCGGVEHLRSSANMISPITSPTISAVRCQGCRLLFVNPRPTRAEIGRYHPDLHIIPRPCLSGWRAPHGQVKVMDQEESGDDRPGWLWISDAGLGSSLAMVRRLLFMA